MLPCRTSTVKKCLLNFQHLFFLVFNMKQQQNSDASSWTCEELSSTMWHQQNHQQVRLSAGAFPPQNQMKSNVIKWNKIKNIFWSFGRCELTQNVANILLTSVLSETNECSSTGSTTRQNRGISTAVQELSTWTGPVWPQRRISCLDVFHFSIYFKQCLQISRQSQSASNKENCIKLSH